MNGNGSERVQFGPFEADLRTHELWKFGIKIRLGGQPFEVLAILLNRPGALVTREELRKRLWAGDTFVGFDHGPNAAVNRLREALSDSVETPRYVETLPRLGYRFIAPVELVNVNVQTAATENSANALLSAPAEFPASAESYPSRQTKVPKAGQWRLYFAGAGGILILSFVGTFFLKMASFGAHAGKISAEARDRELNDGHLSFSPVQRIRPLTSLADETSEPAFSPDGNYVAFRRQAAKPEAFGIYVKAIGSDQLAQLTGNADDCCPVWSPDGRWIAFSRFANNEIGIYVVPAARGQEHTAEANGQSLTVIPGSAERKLDTSAVNPKRGELAWSPDGKTIAFSGGPSIFLLSLEKPGVHRLTEPPPLSEDWGPAFSPDRQKVLFVRSPASGFPDEILAVSVTGGEVTQIASEHARVLGPPQWSADGQSIIFASNHGSHPGLWRVSAEVRDSPVQINDSGWYPAVSRKGYRLAYQRITRSLSIWQMDLSVAGNEQHILIPSTSETDQGPGPQISPDGRKLAYMSDRSGTMEIWVSDLDGNNALQLTAIGSAGTPRWSPDSRSIVFDASGRNPTAIYVVGLQGGAPRLLVPNNTGEESGVCPSWSRDGKWIYFASARNGKFQVSKVAAGGGTPVPMTKHGGHAPLASIDGKYLYYAKTQYANPEIWQVPVEGGAETLVSPMIRPATWASWSVVEQGIVFAGPSGKGRPIVALFDLAKHQVRNLGELNTVPFWVGASHDGKSLVFDHPGWEKAQLILFEKFH